MHLVEIIVEIDVDHKITQQNIINFLFCNYIYVHLIINTL